MIEAIEKVFIMLIIKLFKLLPIVLVSLKKNDALTCYQCTEERSINGLWSVTDLNKILTKLGSIENDKS